MTLCWPRGVPPFAVSKILHISPLKTRLHVFMTLFLKNTKLRTWDPHDHMHKTWIPDHPCKLDLTHKPQLPPFSLLCLCLGKFFLFLLSFTLLSLTTDFTRFQSFYSSVFFFFLINVFAYWEWTLFKNEPFRLLFYSIVIWDSNETKCLIKCV